MPFLVTDGPAVHVEVVAENKQLIFMRLHDADAMATTAAAVADSEFTVPSPAYEDWMPDATFCALMRQLLYNVQHSFIARALNNVMVFTALDDSEEAMLARYATVRGRGRGKGGCKC